MSWLSLFRDAPNAIRRNVSLPMAHRLLRGREADQYIVSYPRSGSTWLRAMLSGLFDPEHGAEPDVFNRLIPGLSGSRLASAWYLPDPRLLHSHTCFTARIRRAVCVVRDGRDAVVSHYHHSITRAGRAMPFSEWLELYWKHWYGPCWHEHTISWLDYGRSHLGEDLLIVKFEDLKAAPEDTVMRIAQFLRLDYTQRDIVNAVELASLEKARQRERSKFGSFSNPDASFYRGGAERQWRSIMAPSDYTHFMQKAHRAIDLAGYDIHP